MGSKKLFFVIVLFCASASAQNFLVPVPPVFLGPATSPRLGANLTISFCNSAATLNQCLAGSAYAQAYADSTNSNPINQVTTPLKTDALGNAPAFFAAPGQYAFTVSGPSITAPQGPYQIAVQCAGTCTFTSATITGALTAQTVNDMLVVGGASGYATCAAALTAAGSNQRTIQIDSTYAGANCTGVPANVAILDLRGNATNWPTNASLPGGHVISFNGNQEGALQGLGVNSNFTSPTITAQAITATSQVTGTLPNAQTMSAIVGELDVVNAATPGTGTMVGIESFNSLNSTAGGALPLWWSGHFGGRMGAADTTSLTLWGAVHADAYVNSGTGALSKAIGFYGEGQSVGTLWNYAAYLIPNHGAGTNNGALLIGFDSTNGGPIDFLDSSGTPHRGVRYDTSNNLHLQAGPGLSLFLDQNDGTNRAFIDTNGLNVAINDGLYLVEGVAPSAVAAKDACYGDSTAHAIKCSYNNGTFLQIPQIIASGTTTLTSGNIANATCQTAVTTAATGAATTDAIEWAYATAPSGTTDALLTISPYVTSGNVNFTRCNTTATNPIASTGIVINWRVVR